MPNSYLGLDIGSKRIGVAVGEDQTGIAHPLVTIDVDGQEIDQIKAIYDERAVGLIVVGYPRNQSGETTPQTRTVEDFAKRLQQAGMVYEFQDESLTSVLAEERLELSGRPYQRADVDAGAAAIILSDYIESNRHAR